MFGPSALVIVVLQGWTRQSGGAEVVTIYMRSTVIGRVEIYRNKTLFLNVFGALMF